MRITFPKQFQHTKQGKYLEYDSLYLCASEMLNNKCALTLWATTYIVFVIKLLLLKEVYSTHITLSGKLFNTLKYIATNVFMTI